VGGDQSRGDWSADRERAIPSQRLPFGKGTPLGQGHGSWKYSGQFTKNLRETRDRSPKDSLIEARDSRTRRKGFGEGALAGSFGPPCVRVPGATGPLPSKRANCKKREPVLGGAIFAHSPCKNGDSPHGFSTRKGWRHFCHSPCKRRDGGFLPARLLLTRTQDHSIGDRRKACKTRDSSAPGGDGAGVASSRAGADVASFAAFRSFRSKSRLRSFLYER